jgi:hypothetical protein
MRSAAGTSVEAQRAALEAIEELEAERARAYARGAELRVELSVLWAAERSGFVEMELAGTALVGQVRAARELEDSERLVELFPRLHGLMKQGEVFVPTAEAILRATLRCSPEVQAEVDARLAGRLVGTNVTDVRRMVQTVILTVEAELDPALTEERLDQARKDARVWDSTGTDGMHAIGAVLDAVTARRWLLDFDALVKAQQSLDARAGVERTVQQVRAEVFAHLPTLVLELVRAARDGRLTELAEVDPEAAAELEQLARDAEEVPLADEEEAADPVTGEIRVETDPFDLEAALAADPEPEPLWEPGPEPTEPEAPEWPAGGWLPHDPAAQDAAVGTTPHSTTPSATATRQDLLVQVLLLRCLQMPLASPVTLNLHVPMATALDLTHAPGILEGHGPLDAFRIRQLLPSASLREVYVDEHTGVPLGRQRKPARPRPGQADLADLLRRLRPVTVVDHVEPRHDPSAALAEQVKERDQCCSGPGCTMPASRCHLDHEDEYPQGPTAEWNLGDKSPRCHGAKHHGWTAERHAEGSTDWTSPTGRVYTSRSVWTSPPRPRSDVEFHLLPPHLVIEIDTDG